MSGATEAERASAGHGGDAERRATMTANARSHAQLRRSMYYSECVNNISTSNCTLGDWTSVPRCVVQQQ